LTATKILKYKTLTLTPASSVKTYFTDQQDETPTLYSGGPSFKY